MERRKAANQIELGSYVYLFESPAAGMTDCVISAHGGHVPGREFNIPANTTVSYIVDYGQSATHGVGPIRSPLSGAKDRYARRNTFSGRKITDQLLGKALGTHWGDATNRDGVQYYEFIKLHQDALHAGAGQSWVPHFVSVRNRRFPFAHHLVWLSNVIELVQSHNPAIVHFYSAACRDTHLDNHLADQAGAQSLQ